MARLAFIEKQVRRKTALEGKLCTLLLRKLSSVPVAR